MSSYSQLVTEVGVSGFIDIAVMTVVIYSVLVWLKRARRAASVLVGMLIVAGAYLVAQQFDLRLTVAVLNGFFAVILVALVVIFQEELRYLFEQVAQLGRPFRKRADSGGPSHLDALARTLADLSRERIGALVVVRGRDPLLRHVHGGESLGGRLSEPLLKSLFDPHSLGHDGAVVVEGDSVERFGCHLPLSRRSAELRGVGTRHAAALGLSELVDALCLVVSEERGTISIARHGRLRALEGPAELRRVLGEFHREVSPAEEGGAWRTFLRRNWREKLIAVSLAAALWFVMVHESRIVLRTFRVPVKFAEGTGELAVQSVRPPEVSVTFSAQRKDLYLVDTADIVLTLRTFGLEPGPTTLPITATDLTYPQDLALEAVEPDQVRVELVPAGSAPP